MRMQITPPSLHELIDEARFCQRMSNDRAQGSSPETVLYPRRPERTCADTGPGYNYMWHAEA